MPNIITNLYLADRIGPGSAPDYLLGTTLPNFMAMYRQAHGQTIVPRQFVDNPAFVAGIKFNHYAQSLQAHNPLYQDLNRFVVDDLALVDGMGTNPNKRAACAQAITDLALDGVVTDWARTRAVREVVSDHVTTGQTSLEGRGLEDFEDYIKNFFMNEIWRGYRSSAVIAYMVHSRFKADAQRKIELPESVVPSLAVVANEQIRRLRKYGGRLLKLTKAALDAEIRFDFA